MPRTTSPSKRTCFGKWSSRTECDGCFLNLWCIDVTAALEEEKKFVNEPTMESHNWDWVDGDADYNMWLEATEGR